MHSTIEHFKIFLKYHNLFTYRFNYNYDYKHQVFILHTKNSEYNDKGILYTRCRLARAVGMRSQPGPVEHSENLTTCKYFFISPNIG